MIGFKKKPQLSIVIPVFNTKDYLVECLESVKNSITKINAEVILIDDGSTDGSLEIIKEYVSKDKRFKLLHSDQKGPGGARNIGIEHSNGEYLAFVDSDDYVAEDIYENMLAVAERDACDMVVCDVIRKDGAKFIHSELHRKAYHNLRNHIVDVNEDLDLTFDCTVWNRIIRVSLYKDNNVRFPDVSYCEDFPVVQSLYCLSKKTAFVHKWGYCWRVRKESITRNYSRKHIEEEIQMLRLLKDIANTHNPNPNYLKTINYKILALEFVGCMNLLKDVPKETALDYVDLVASFIEADADLQGVENLNLYNQQKIKLILERDVDGLIRLLNYKKANYMNAPVIETGEGYEMILPDDIFTIESRSFKNEFNNMPYWMSIDSVEKSGDVVTIHTHIYIRRISMPDFSSQNVKVYLVNDMSGAELELPVVKELRPSLTSARGAVLNYDDYRDYNYNYDGTGFAFDIDVNDFAGSADFRGWNYIMMECDNKVGRKNLVLRFGTKKSLDFINKISIGAKGAKVDFTTDEIQVFGIKVYD